MAPWMALASAAAGPSGVAAVFTVDNRLLAPAGRTRVEFLRASLDERRGALSELLRHPKAILLVFGLTMGGTTAF